MESEVYTQVKASVKKLLNIDLTYYKDEQMKRRLDSWLVRTRAASWSDYFKVLAENSNELTRFRDYLTINVTEFFRDPDRWATLAKDVIPQLLNSSNQRNGLRVWSAGCSIGVEAYTLSMVLDQVSPNLPHQILATDLDRGALQKARARGPYTLDDMRNLTAEQKHKYITAEPPYHVKEQYARRITFQEQNLLMDQFDTGFDLIVCRNVIIYFTTEAKSHLYTKFHAALRPGGVLFLGGTEIIPRPTEIGFRNFGISFYMKV